MALLHHTCTRLPPGFKVRRKGSLWWLRKMVGVPVAGVDVHVGVAMISFCPFCGVDLKDEKED